MDLFNADENFKASRSNPSIETTGAFTSSQLSSPLSLQKAINSTVQEGLEAGSFWFGTVFHFKSVKIEENFKALGNQNVLFVILVDSGWLNASLSATEFGIASHVTERNLSESVWLYFGFVLRHPSTEDVQL
jgi:hypothetical protein